MLSQLFVPSEVNLYMKACLLRERKKVILRHRAKVKQKCGGKKIFIMTKVKFCRI